MCNDIVCARCARVFFDFQFVEGHYVQKTNIKEKSEKRCSLSLGSGFKWENPNEKLSVGVSFFQTLYAFDDTGCTKFENRGPSSWRSKIFSGLTL